MICAQCQTEFDAGEGFCPTCAAPVAPQASAPGASSGRSRARGRGNSSAPEASARQAAPAPRLSGRHGASGGRSASAMPYADAAAPLRQPGAHALPGGPKYVRKRPDDPVPRTLQRIVPIQQHKRHTGIIVLCALIALIIVAAVGYMVLRYSPGGQVQMAAWGYKSTTTAYWRLGDNYMQSGLVQQALSAYKTAYDQELKSDDGPSVDGSLKLGNAYENDGQLEEAVALYTQLMNTLAPAHAEAYARMARMYREESRHAEAVAMMELGKEKTGQELFDRMIREYSPEPPEPSEIGKRMSTELTLSLTSEEGTVILYTIDGSDPLESDQLYIEPLLLLEGTTQVRAVSVQENGVPSKEMNETYVIQYPTPSAPKTNVASGTYDRAPTVSIRGEAGTVAIHYTIDGSIASEHSPLYTGPIKLPNGRTKLRAVAIDERGKSSYEMIIDYKVNGNVKKSFNKNDVFKNLTLMKTNYDQFVRAHGQPNSYEQVGTDATGTLFRAEYDFGYAGFVQANEDAKALLYELSVRTTKLSAPRSLKVGDSTEKVLAAFRDVGGPANERNERMLYTLDAETMGIYKQEADGSYAAHYYFPRGKNDYVELSFYFEKDAVARIHWLRYIGE